MEIVKYLIDKRTIFSCTLMLFLFPCIMLKIPIHLFIMITIGFTCILYFFLYQPIAHRFTYEWIIILIPYVLREKEYVKTTY